MSWRERRVAYSEESCGVSRRRQGPGDRQCAGASPAPLWTPPPPRSCRGYCAVLIHASNCRHISHLFPQTVTSLPHTFSEHVPIELTTTEARPLCPSLLRHLPAPLHARCHVLALCPPANLRRTDSALHASGHRRRPEHPSREAGGSLGGGADARALERRSARTARNHTRFLQRCSFEATGIEQKHTVHLCRLRLAQGDGVWSEVWPSAMAMAEVVLSKPELVRGKRGAAAPSTIAPTDPLLLCVCDATTQLLNQSSRGASHMALHAPAVCDVGCGLGLEGLAAAAAGCASVVLTDREPRSIWCAAFPSPSSRLSSCRADQIDFSHSE